MKAKFLLISLLCMGLLSCNNGNGSLSENQNEVENNFDYGKVNYPQGAVKSVFSVSKYKKVAFSQGNLQYQASTNTWRFAKKQYDRIDDLNGNISSTYRGWIDLFGWGTGGNPTNASESNNYYPRFVDWGVNKISNGGKMKNVWFTLSNDEWNYIVYGRPNASNKQGVAEVNGITGLVLLPDNWTMPSGAKFKSGYAPNRGYEYYKTVNTYTASEWTLMEEAGAVFLPAATYRLGTDVFDVGCSGCYWSSTEYETMSAYSLDFEAEEVDMVYGMRSCGKSVRLCAELFTTSSGYATFGSSSESQNEVEDDFYNKNVKSYTANQIKDNFNNKSVNSHTTNRLTFRHEADVHSYLRNHRFVGSDGITLSENSNMSLCANGRALTLAIRVVEFNEDQARFAAQSLYGGYTMNFYLDVSNGYIYYFEDNAYYYEK